MALGSRARTYMVSVDLVMFFGVLYHLPHPILALQKIAVGVHGHNSDASAQEFTGRVGSLGSGSTADQLGHRP